MAELVELTGMDARKPVTQQWFSGDQRTIFGDHTGRNEQIVPVVTELAAMSLFC